MEQSSDQSPNRRHVITGIAAAGIGVPLLAACGSSTAASTSTQPGASAAPASSGGSSLTPLVKASDVPVGGGVILNQAVVTQPTAGVFKAFSPVCTHSGCIVAEVQNQQILCPCHGSTFSIATGAVEGGPAPSPLPAINITNKGGEIYAS